MSGLTDFAVYLRRGGAVIEALLHHLSTGTLGSPELRSVAQDAVQDH